MRSVVHFNSWKGITSMRLFYSLPVIAALTLGSAVASAQAPSQVTTAAPTLYAEADSPATYSSSVDNSLPASHALAGAAAGVAAPATGSSKPFSGLGVGVKLGTVGIGFDVATPIFPGRLNLRAGAGFFSYNINFTQDTNTVAGNLKLNNAEIMADFFPFKGSFRLSGGVTAYNNTGATGTLQLGNTFTLGSTQYTTDPSNPATGTVGIKFGSTAVPRVTFGWGNMVPKSGHFRFETELGVDIATPTVTWNMTGEACTGSFGEGFRPAATGGAPTATSCSSGYGPVATSDIQFEQNKLQNSVNGLRVFPIISIGLSYKIF
jgi:hypothetical protein